MLASHISPFNMGTNVHSSAVLPYLNLLLWETNFYLNPQNFVHAKFSAHMAAVICVPSNGCDCYSCYFVYTLLVCCCMYTGVHT